MTKPNFGEVIVDIPGTPENHIQQPPAGWEIVGEVTDHVGSGALVRETGCGVYARANINTVTSLPQTAVREALAAMPHTCTEQEKNMSDTVRIRYYVRTDMVGSMCEDHIEMPRSEWEAMSEKEKDEEMKEYAFNHMEWGYNEVEAGKDSE